MKKLILVFIVIFAFSSTNAQTNSDKVNKEVVTEKIDKSSEMAFIYRNGNLVEKGVLKNGKREGVWQSFNENGLLTAEASFSNGLKSGLWNIYENANLKYVLHYQDNLRVKANNLAIAE